MGLQDYTTKLTPSSEEKIPFQRVANSLVDLGFVSLDPTHYVSGAELGELPQHEIAFMRHDSDAIVEALIRLHSEVPHTISSISVRFALCQPQAVTTMFLTIVDELTHEYKFNIAGEHIQYCPECLDEFRTEVEQHVAAGKARWRELFEGDTSELPMRVDQAWSYFLQRHPNLITAR